MELLGAGSRPVCLFGRNQDRPFSEFVVQLADKAAYGNMREAGAFTFEGLDLLQAGQPLNADGIPGM